MIKHMRGVKYLSFCANSFSSGTVISCINFATKNRKEAIVNMY
jgi:hypothetical protein